MSVLFSVLCFYVLRPDYPGLLVFRRKDLCEAKHDVVRLKFCSKLTIWGGGGKSSRRFALKSPSTIYPKSPRTILGGGVNHPDDLPSKSTWRFGVNRTWQFEGKLSGQFTPPPEIVLGDLG